MLAATLVRQFQFYAWSKLCLHMSRPWWCIYCRWSDGLYIDVSVRVLSKLANTSFNYCQFSACNCKPGRTLFYTIMDCMTSVLGGIGVSDTCVHVWWVAGVEGEGDGGVRVAGVAGVGGAGVGLRGLRDEKI